MRKARAARSAKISFKPVKVGAIYRQRYYDNLGIIKVLECEETVFGDYRITFICSRRDRRDRVIIFSAEFHDRYEEINDKG